LAARFVRDEEVVGSNPATPTVKHQVRPGAERSAPGLICSVAPFWEPIASRFREPAPRARLPTSTQERVGQSQSQCLKAKYSVREATTMTALETMKPDWCPKPG
jgi:hypothetical protein